VNLEFRHTLRSARANEGNRPVAQHDYRELVAIFAGGALGTLARAGLSTLTVDAPGSWPWPIFTVNIVGAFLVGYFNTRLLERLPLSGYRRPLLGTGLCGGLTTFSTMQVEILEMIEDGRWDLAIGYTVTSIVLGLLAVHLATALVRRVRVRG
jgi:fluoride exporter